MQRTIINDVRPALLRWWLCILICFLLGVLLILKGIESGINDIADEIITAWPDIRNSWRGLPYRHGGA